MSALKTVAALIKVGITLAICGGLARATYFMAKEAARAQQQGLVSLTKLNRQLGM